MFFLIKICIWGGLFYLGSVFLKRNYKLPEIKKEIVLGTLVVAYALMYFYWNVTRHDSYHSFAFDISVYLQALSKLKLYAPILGKRLLAEHTSMILWFLVPLVKNFPSPLTLFAIQALVLSSAAIPLYYLARRMGTGDWTALLMAFIYLNFIYVRRMAFSDFHVENLMPLFFLTLFNLMLSTPDWKFWVLLAFTLMIKEDVGFYLCPWAILLGLYKPELRTPALITAAVSFAGGVLSLMFLLPSNKGVYPYFAYWSHYGKGLFNIVGGAFLKPFMTIGVFLKPEFTHVVMAMAVLPLVTFWGIVLLIPVWVQLASNHTAQASLDYYYAAPIVPFLFAALAAGWVKIRDRFILEGPKKPLILWGLAAFLLVFNFYWISPMVVLPEHKAMTKLLNKLPHKGRILAQANVAPHISRQGRVRVLGKNSFLTKPHIVVVNVTGNIWPFSRESYLKTINTLRLDPRYYIWKEEAGLVIFVRKPGVKKNSSKPLVSAVQAKGKLKATPAKQTKTENNASANKDKPVAGKKQR